MDLLLDTQVIVWAISGDRRLPAAIRDTFVGLDTRLFISAVTAFEFADLEARGRFPPGVTFGDAIASLDAVVLDLPSDCWRLIETLPPLHKDPVDRMLVAHAIHAGLTLVTADEKIRSYPVRTLW